MALALSGNDRTMPVALCACKFLKFVIIVDLSIAMTGYPSYHLFWLREFVWFSTQYSEVTVRFGDVISNLLPFWILGSLRLGPYFK